MKHVAKTFTNERVVLDDHEYIDCSFKDCEIVYSATGAVSLRRCDFDAPRFAFHGAAGDTVKVLVMLASDPNTDVVVRNTFPMLFRKP